MGLHRDIYWLGRQWAVTGYGMQAIDPKLNGEFDIEASRLWKDGLLESMHAQKWLNIEDFSKGLSVARARYPEPPRKAAPLEKNVSSLEAGGPIVPPRQLARKFEMRIEGWPAKFVRPWRVWVRP